jgi:hypothetical protein
VLHHAGERGSVGRPDANPLFGAPLEYPRDLHIRQYNQIQRSSPSQTIELRVFLAYLRVAGRRRVWDSANTADTDLECNRIDTRGRTCLQCTVYESSMGRTDWALPLLPAIHSVNN